MALFRRWRRAAPQVPGVQPQRTKQYELYDGESLAHTAPVTAALERAPRTFLAIRYDGDDVQTEALPSAELCAYLSVAACLDRGIGDGIVVGRSWEVSIDESVIVMVEPYSGVLERALAEQPDVDEAVQDDRGDFSVMLARPLPVDEVLARFINAISMAHREEARRRGIEVWD